MAAFGIYMTEHLLLPPEPFAPLTERATRAASVKASLTPRLRLAEHSCIIISLTFLDLSGEQKWHT